MYLKGKRSVLCSVSQAGRNWICWRPSRAEVDEEKGIGAEVGEVDRAPAWDAVRSTRCVFLVILLAISARNTYPDWSQLGLSKPLLKEISSNSINSLKLSLLVFLFYRWGNQDIERLKNFPTCTLKITAGTWFWLLKSNSGDCWPEDLKFGHVPESPGKLAETCISGICPWFCFGRSRSWRTRPCMQCRFIIIHPEGLQGDAAFGPHIPGVRMKEKGTPRLLCGTCQDDWKNRT